VLLDADRCMGLKVRRAVGPQKVLLLVADGVRIDGRRDLLAFVRVKTESQAGWEGLLIDLYRRGLRGQQLQVVITDGYPGLAAAIPAVYPRAWRQRNVQSVDRIICAIFSHFNEDWKTQTLKLFTQAA
jgi:putative transposase